MSNNSLLNNSIIASKDEKGLWIYKANPDYKIPFKKDGDLKQHYKDMPRYNCIIEAEDDFMKDYNQELKESIKEIAQVLNKFGN